MLTYRDSKNKHLHQKNVLKISEQVSTCRPYIRPYVKKIKIKQHKTTL